MGYFPSPSPDATDQTPQAKAFGKAGSLADNTRVAYWGDLRRFLDWGGVVPASSKMVASYLVGHASSHKYATLVRWKVSIGKAHSARGFTDPTKSELVYTVLRGIQRKHGKEQRKVAPLLKEQVISVVNAMGDRLKDKRDMALILAGFAGGLRRSEITSLDVADLKEAKVGVEIFLPGNRIGIPHARGPVCAVRSLKEWLEESSITEGPVFQGINRHGQRSGKPLTGHGVALIVKERVAAIGLDPALYSGFSLRTGLAASAVAAGIPFRTVNTLEGPGIL